MQQLKHELTYQIKEIEEELGTQLESLQTKLSEREEDLSKVKRLFVEKLKEIETSFNEIS